MTICSCKELINNFDESIRDKPSLCMAYLSHLAYHSFEHIQYIANKTKAHKLRMYDRNGTQAFLIEYDTFVAIAFRGTTGEKVDLRTDFKFWRKPWFGLKVHTGFANALDQILADVLGDLIQIRGKKIYYTGHSLGGALATLLCVPYSPDVLITFGCPRVSGGKDFKDIYNDIEVKRYINTWDLIAYLPQAIFGYSHPTKSIIIHNEFMNPLKAHYSTEYIKKIDQYYKNGDEQ